MGALSAQELSHITSKYSHEDCEKTKALVSLFKSQNKTHEARGKPIKTIFDATEFFTEEFLDADTERFKTLCLDQENRVTRIIHLAEGDRRSVGVNIPKMFKEVIRSGAYGIILVHNHPFGGNASPSKADIELTQAVIEAAKLLDLTVHDHIIVARTELHGEKILELDSMRARGFFPDNETYGAKDRKNEGLDCEF